MLVKCNPKCRDNGGMTDASLDIKSDCVICNTCGEELTNISSYTKASMKRIGDIIRRSARKAFTFFCSECEDKKEVNIVDDKPVGHDCDYENYKCNFSITQNMINVIKITKENQDGGIESE